MKTLLLLSCLLVAATVASGQPLDTSEIRLSTTAEALTVQAKRIAHGELATRQLTQLDIYLNATAKADPLLAVNSLPAATNPDETANVSLRGSPAVATGVYLNGVPLRSAVRLDQSNGVGQFSIFGQLPVRDLTIYPSSPPLEYSQASAGVVALETAVGRPARTTHGLSLNLVGVGYQQARRVGKTGSLRGYVNATDLTAFRVLNGDRLKELESSRSVDGMLSYAGRTGRNTELQAFYLGFAEGYRYQVAVPGGDQLFEQRKPRHLAIMNLKTEGERWDRRINQLLDWERPRFTFSDTSTTIERLTTHSALHAERRGAGFSLRLGAAVNSYSDRIEGAGFRVNDLNYTVETYAQVQRRIGSDWLLGAGVKPVYDGRPAVNLHAAVRYRPTEPAWWHLSVGRHTQLLPPGAATRDWQRLDLRQAALEYQHKLQDWTLRGAVYAKREMYERNEDLTVVGGEAEVDYRRGNWVAGLSAVSVRSRGELPTARDIPLAVRGQVRWDANGWSAGLSHRGRSGTVGRFGELPVFERYPIYNRLDLALSKVLPIRRGTVILYLNVNNLLDTNNINYTIEGSDVLHSRRLLFFGAVWGWAE